ncbi:SDR family oxidoreductase [Parashewanella curva]|uniref:SDR family oxidoreductase n=1 Tax=Parashewanella curva TaxID=2338552 RepID=A0A3L8PUC1_9GAMM|nr:SDR family oxidoreductase [Parashewanella curva]RLV58920.1 SDR family oxidoreductase [Parashewanella curva]
MVTTTQYHCLNNKTVFITGGASGIGAAVIRTFLQQGAKIAFVDINLKASVDLLEAFSDKKQNIWFRQLDITHSEGLKQAITDAYHHFNGLDVLINCAADDTRFNTSDIAMSDWHDSIDINLTPAFAAAQSAYQLMQKHQSGSIINFGSINALIGMENMAPYITAKAGLMGMTKALAKDFGKDNIRVNAILPGWVATQKQLDSWLTDEQEQKWMKHLAIKKRIQPEDVANLALFLASNQSTLITGQCISVDAGRT